MAAAQNHTDPNRSTSTDCRKVFIQRDYSEGTNVKFQTKFPPELESFDEYKHSAYTHSLNYEHRQLSSVGSGSTVKQFGYHEPEVNMIIEKTDPERCSSTLNLMINNNKNIERHLFEETINTLNSIYAEAEKTSGRTFCEGCFACLTAYLIYLCIETHYQKCLKRIAAYLDDQNETIYLPRNLHITDPIERGLRVIEIAILKEPANRS